jgi:predicted O-methyltransferase YrrM
MKNRLELIKHFGKLGFKVGAEIGVGDGRFSEIMCQNIPNLKLYAIDFWKPYKDYNDYKFRKTFHYLYATAKQKLANYDCVLIKKYSMEAVKNFVDESLDFVFIDGNHRYDFVVDDIREWSKKVRIGGIVSGHDYYITRTHNVGVIKAVDEYTKEHKYNLKLTDWDKKNPCPDERQPSWYFIK